MSDSDEDNFATFGEALDPLDEENLPRKKPVTIEDQYATDAQGRRRFHGAFTGGFSAGYFNSVGTRDGWRPQQFKSSRSSKAGGVSQRPEDFMDEEDTGEFGIAPTGIRATSEFTDHGKGTKRERPKTNNDGPIPGVPVLKDLLKPASDTVGVSLLRKMGWKPGQGVGPRVSKKEKKKTRQRNERKKVYGCSLPNQELVAAECSSESSEDDNEEILFAPDDYEPFRCNPKDNYFGIGYSGLERRAVLGHVNLFDAPAFQIQDKNKKLSIRGQAFGVGAFEADDEDIYARDDMSRYDFALGPAKSKGRKSRWVDEAESSRGKCLEGFVSAKSQLQKKKTFEPPEIPKDFKPIHVIRKSRFSPPVESEEYENHKRKGLGRHDLNAETRSVILGEPTNSSGTLTQEPDYSASQIPSSKASPAVNMIARTLNLHGKEQVEERSRLETQRVKSHASWMDKLTTTSFVRGGIEGLSGESSESLRKLEDFKADLPKQKNRDHVQMLKPFVDEEKQKRFEKFQDFSEEEMKEKLATLQPLSMTEWEREHEMEEFKQAARLFKTTNNTKSLENELANEASLAGSEAPQDPMVSAARIKMFGKLTRTVESWQPASIVCKRFNIPEPKTGCVVQDTKKGKKYSVFDSLDFCTDDTKFRKATDTSGSYKEPFIPYQSSVGRLAHTGDSQNSMNVLDTSDIDASLSKSSGKIRNFEASYEKIFGKSGETSASSFVDVSVTLSQDHNNQGSDDSTEKTSTVSTSSVIPSKDKSDEKKDLFKAIFLSSSEDSDSDKEMEEDVNSDTMKSLLIGKSANELNLQRNNSPPRGIFAKLDLDDLLGPPKSNDKVNRESAESKLTDKVQVFELSEEQLDKDPTNANEGGSQVANPVCETEARISRDMYGPALPKRPIEMNDSLAASEVQHGPVFRSAVIPKLDVSDKSIKWVEKTKEKKSKREKKKHKHKDKKHKHKSKKDKR